MSQRCRTVWGSAAARLRRSVHPVRVEENRRHIQETVKNGETLLQFTDSRWAVCSGSVIPEVSRFFNSVIDIRNRIGYFLCLSTPAYLHVSEERKILERRSTCNTYFLFKRSFIALFGERVYSGKVWEIKLCKKLNFYPVFYCWRVAFLCWTLNLYFWWILIEVTTIPAKSHQLL